MIEKEKQRYEVPTVSVRQLETSAGMMITPTSYEILIRVSPQSGVKVEEFKTDADFKDDDPFATDGIFTVEF